MSLYIYIIYIILAIQYTCMYACNYIHIYIYIIYIILAIQYTLLYILFILY